MNDDTRRTRRFDPYRILAPNERERHLAGYLRFLEERDGERDIEAQTLANRESYFRDLASKPVRWQGDVDETGFYTHMRRGRGPEVDERTVLLLAAAKANVSEAYGAELERAAFAGRPERAAENPLYLHLMFEELYHSRIREEVCRTGGFEPEFRLPSRTMRATIHTMAYLPDQLRWILIYASEVLGSEVFNVLRSATRHFSEEPEVESRLRELLTEIWIDEVFHVAYLRAKLNPPGIRIARRLVPLVAATVFPTLPQSGKIGLGARAVLANLRRGIEMPPDVHWMPGDPGPS
jgi:hypothetical protein